MKSVILAGGLGTRLSEETHLKPKPMVEIAGKPILWHIMKIYSSYGINEFIICCGYKGYVIKEYFANYLLHTSDVTFFMDNDNKMQIHCRKNEPWTVTLVDTSDLSQTGGRLARVCSYLNDEPFCFTYGDGVSDVNIDLLISHHLSHGLLATLTAVQPPGRYGAIRLEDSVVKQFQEKPDGDGSWINGGYFVLSPKVIERITDDSTSWEEEPLVGLASENELAAFKHYGYWQPMDTLREKNILNNLWSNNKAPWKVWD